MKNPIALAVGAVLLLPAAASAQDNWTGTGELGLAAARGNARSENLNAKLDFTNEDERWKHRFSATAQRAKGEVTGDFDGDGTPETRFELNSNRYTLGASSALKMDERRSWISALRYERDDFNTYESQATVSVGYGHTFFDTDERMLNVEVGPGYRWVELAEPDSDGDDSENGPIFRGLVEYRQQLTSNTTLSNKFLVESGSDNTFAQNELGVAVAMNERFGLKVALQARHNTDTAPTRTSTDTLTTMNLVYSFK
jgi:putative salt-induced outer membrane protein